MAWQGLIESTDEVMVEATGAHFSTAAFKAHLKRAICRKREAVDLRPNCESATRTAQRRARALMCHEARSARTVPELSWAFAPRGGDLVKRPTRPARMLEKRPLRPRGPQGSRSLPPWRRLPSRRFFVRYISAPRRRLAGNPQPLGFGDVMLAGLAARRLYLPSEWPHQGRDRGLGLNLMASRLSRDAAVRRHVDEQTFRA